MEYLNFSYIDHILICLNVWDKHCRWHLLWILWGTEKHYNGLSSFLSQCLWQQGKSKLIFTDSNFLSLLNSSTLSGVSLLVSPAEIYYYGTQYMFVAIAPIISIFAVNFIFLPVFWKLQLTTIFEYLEIRFTKSIRTLISCLFTLTNFCFLPVIIYAPSLAFNQGNLLNFTQSLF